uniref:Transmembrane protein 130 n=1 Tax=Rousettus aegyptiacus TaxID=9407 RepID=A0A7J8FN97_ROUAE|nr:transmembrane protein 130 [Rousettus aegyptiacus]
MAPALWPRVGSILWLACLLPWAPAAVAAGLYELHLAADSPAITGVEASITASLVASDNGSLVLPTSFHSYRFHWLHTPLLLTGKSDEAFSSTIRAVGNAPGDFPVSVWVTAANCWMCQPVARSLLVLSITESLTGNIVIMQNTSLPWPNYLAKTALKISFILHDPSNFFKTASFLYSWDFGDGTQMITEDSVVYYNYSIIGAATVKLRVVAEWEQATLGAAGKGVAQKTGDFSTSLKLQETLRGIQVSGPTQLQNFQKMTVTLNFLGSPPLTLCWRLKHECLPLEEGECHPVSVFAFPCATLITMVLALIMYLTLRHATHQKDMVEVADFDFSPMSDKNLEPPTGVKCCCQTCCRPFFLETPSEYLEVVRGSHGLLPPFYKSAKTYTV